MIFANKNIYLQLLYQLKLSIPINILKLCNVVKKFVLILFIIIILIIDKTILYVFCIFNFNNKKTNE